MPEYELVDIEYRNGKVVRGVDPEKRRWTLCDPKFGGSAGSDFDIARWQPAGAFKARYSDAEQAA